MRRTGKHKVKQEHPETSSSSRDTQERDLTYYIHDRVELMHQVFSILKPKELKAMAPNCVQHISLNDLQELCMEELLGISSKRLCAILNGAEPPSDTETSSTSTLEKLETISLDSISSDEEILSESSNKKKKYKHRRRTSKPQKHEHRSSSETSENNEDRSKASRAGLTVLELLELQARARAIRAQLQQEQAADLTAATVASASHHVSDDEVEIKEEPAEVVEISSDDEKPTIQEDKQKGIAQESKNQSEKSTREAQIVTKRINDLIITVPQTKPTRKIKLNRNKAPPVPKVSDKNNENIVTNTNQPTNEAADKESSKTVNKIIIKKNTENEKTVETSQLIEKTTAKEKQKKRLKKKVKGKSKSKEGSDHDEITLQLSDSEKMDLLEDLDRKNYDNVSSSSTEDSESSSVSSENEEESRTGNSSTTKKMEPSKNISDKEEIPNPQSAENNKNIAEKYDKSNTESCAKECSEDKKLTEKTLEHSAELRIVNAESTLENADNISEKQIDNTVIEEIILENIPIGDDKLIQVVTESLETPSLSRKIDTQSDEIPIGSVTTQNVIPKESDVKSFAEHVGEKRDVIDTFQKNKKEMSEGEISDRESSEVEASDVKPEIVCISDEEVKKNVGNKKKKNKKKEKKAKREKKSKNVLDFRNVTNQNFYTESNSKDNNIDKLGGVNTITPSEATPCVDDEICEILELSDDSSYDEEDGNSVLSKEPTTEEIEALSAKIDEIEREDVVTEEQIRAHERLEAVKEIEADAENISWKDRYLDSKKVKNVLSTSNILNAMRKKNIELKRKLELSKTQEQEVMSPEVAKTTETILEEGSIAHYNTLIGSTKYIDPIADIVETKKPNPDVGQGKVSKEMKKDAKQLFKMYKKLLKYNDLNRPSDSLKKKKKKKEKKNKREKNKMEGDTKEKINP